MTLDQAHRDVPGDAGGIVLGWLAKVTTVLVIGGILAFDLISMATTHTTVLDDAAAVARSASRAAMKEKPDSVVLLAAEESAAERGVILVPETMTITDSGAVTVTVERHADTMVLSYIPPVQRWLDVRATYRVEPL